MEKPWLLQFIYFTSTQINHVKKGIIFLIKSIENKSKSGILDTHHYCTEFIIFILIIHSFIYRLAINLFLVILQIPRMKKVRLVDKKYCIKKQDLV